METIFQNIIDASDHYAIFGFKPQIIDESVIRKKYREIALLIHPDKHPQTPQLAQQCFVKLSQAFEILNDAESQRSYLVQLTGSSYGINKAKRKQSEEDFGYGWKRRKSEKKMEKSSSTNLATKWWEKSWSEVEAELARQTALFEAKKAKNESQRQAHAELRTKLREKREKRIKKNISWLKEMYGISDDEENENTELQDTKVVNPPTRGFVPEPASFRDSTFASSGGLEVNEISKSSGLICTICSRQFVSTEKLRRHEASSELHQQNLLIHFNAMFDS